VRNRWKQSEKIGAHVTARLLARGSVCNEGCPPRRSRYRQLEVESWRYCKERRVGVNIPFAIISMSFAQERCCEAPQARQRHPVHTYVRLAGPCPRQSKIFYTDMTREGAIQKPVALLHMPLSDTRRLAEQGQVVYLTLELKFL
jgi:hypothetical protein